MVRWLARFGIALSFVAVGISHFTDPEVFVGIMPTYLPWHLELVYLSGIFEILGGLGLLFPVSRRFAAYGLLALLVAVYPANIHMLVNEVYLEGMRREPWLLWLRMPFQLVFAFAVGFAGDLWFRPSPSAKIPASPDSGSAGESGDKDQCMGKSKGEQGEAQSRST
ncbi:MAG TPA: hypothetical protein DEB46_06055 [Myxococcales bacterium]|nr:hypothetical protein [Myxococcales bacterium]